MLNRQRTNKMNTTLSILIVLCTLVFSCKNTVKDNNQPHYLDGLTLVPDDEAKNVKPDGEVKVYTENGRLLAGEERVSLMISGDYEPDLYINKDNTLTVIVLKKVTAEEKQNLQSQITDTGKNHKMIGEKAIPFKAVDIGGNVVSSKTLEGKVIVLNFWFVGCAPCIHEMPELNRLVAEYADKDIVFLGLSKSDATKIKNFLKFKTFDYQLFPDTNEIAEEYEINGYPTHIIIDRTGIVQFYTSGLGSDTIKALENEIKNLL